MNERTVFVTGTDTGVGKSIFTAILALRFQKKNKKTAIIKPIQTGFPKDTDFLITLTGNKIPVFNTYTFSLPAAPLVASKHENKEIDLKRIIRDIKELESQFDHVIVEGIGGIAVPMTEVRAPSSDLRKRKPQVAALRSGLYYLIADLIKDLNYPTVIVARPTLGTINHTVLTIEFAKQQKLNVLGFVISGYDYGTQDAVIKTAPGEISSITSTKCLIKIPLLKNLNYESLATNAELSSSNAPSCLA